MAYFDLRLPLGWLFLIIGGLLTASGFFVSPVSSDGNALGLNINLFWGVPLFFFGLICLGSALRHSQKRGPSGVTIKP
jgi:hypothetical protein